MTREELKTPVAAVQLGGASVFEIPYGPLAAATVLEHCPSSYWFLFFQRKIVHILTAALLKAELILDSGIENYG